MSKIAELYGLPTIQKPEGGWGAVVRKQHCPYLDRKCLKGRKSTSDISIGTCSVYVNKDDGTQEHMVICPYRLLEAQQIFIDCLPLLSGHERGNEYHVTNQLNIPGGKVDYCLASVRKDGTVVDFVGIEFQTLDTTGTVWPERQRFLHSHKIKVDEKDRAATKKFGMNWKMTAKTILVQLLHKVETFEHVGKKLVLICQTRLLKYMRDTFIFGHIKEPNDAHAMRFHAYDLAAKVGGGFQLVVGEQFSTTRAGVEKCLRLKASGKVKLEKLQELVQSKIASNTKLLLSNPGSIPALGKDESKDEE